MININGKGYKLYYLDTCALSMLVKDREVFGSNLLNLVLSDGIIAVSSYSLWELKSSPKVYDEVLDLITTLPAVLLKDEDTIVNEEYQLLNKKIAFINPIAHHLLKHINAVQGINILELINKHITENKKDSFKQKMKGTFKVLGSKPSNIYSREELKSKSTIESSVKLTAYQLAAEFLLPQLLQYSKLEKEFPVVEFSSLMAISYILHYKYQQIERKGLESDIPDILISAFYPYVDTVVTERNQCSAIKQIQKRHNFFNGLKAISMNQIPDGKYEN